MGQWSQKWVKEDRARDNKFEHQAMLIATETLGLEEKA